eukprot:1624539-Pyramimonas_sp.AAC.1
MSVVASALPALKVAQLPIEAFLAWEDAPLFDGVEPPKLKRLKGTSEVHMEYYNDAGLQYPPEIQRYDDELQVILSPLTNAQIEVPLAAP